MKRILFLFFAILAFFTNAIAQKLIINNTSCTDVYYIVHADNGSGCGPDVDFSNATNFNFAVSLQAGTKPVVYDFNGTTAAPNFTWNSMGVSGASSGNLSGNPFNIFQVDVFTTCYGGIPPGGGTCSGSGLPLDGCSVFNPNCGTSSAAFVESWNNQCGSCCTCCPPLPNVCIACLAAPNNNSIIYVDFTIVGSDWHIDIHM